MTTRQQRRGKGDEMIGFREQSKTRKHSERIDAECGAEVMVSLLSHVKDQNDVVWINQNVIFLELGQEK